MFSITELTCRVCLHEQQILINVFDELEDIQTNLSCLLEKCGDIQVLEDDIFPKYLCEECTRELLISAKFRDKCAKSKEILDEVIRENKDVASRSCDDLSEFIEYSTGELGDDALDTNDAEDMEPEPPISDEVRSENEFRRKSCDEDVMGTITFPQEQPALTGAIATQEEECSFDSNITFDETTEVETTDNTLDYTTVPNEDYEVHIDLSDSAFIKSIPLKVRKQNSFKCDICGAAFVQAINLQKHMQKTHVPDKYFTCSVCNHWFSLEVELFKHAKYCKEAETDEDHTDSNEHDIKRLVKSANVPIESHRRCVYCERDFQTPFALRMHLRTHTGERPFPCKFCDKSFKTQSSLNAHLKRHTGQADFVCSVCGKAFFERGNLDVHFRSHTGERPHSCTVCHKTFTRVFLLELHMRTHTGEKPFSCSFCDRSFRQRSDWKSHLSTHAGKQYSCNFCSKSYIKRSSLVQHNMRAHSVIHLDLENTSQTASEEQIEDNSEIHNFDDIIEESEEVLPSNEVA